MNLVPLWLLQVNFSFPSFFPFFPSFLPSFLLFFFFFPFYGIAEREWNLEGSYSVSLGVSFEVSESQPGSVAGFLAAA